MFVCFNDCIKCFIKDHTPFFSKISPQVLKDIIFISLTYGDISTLLLSTSIKTSLLTI